MPGWFKKHHIGKTNEMKDHNVDINKKVDIVAYADAFKKCRDIFIERREAYRDIAEHKELNEDTLIDLINYGLQVLSRR